MFKKMIITLSIVGLLMVVPFSRASANPPDIIREPIEGSFDFNCGDFVVRDEWVGEVRGVIQSWDQLQGTAHWRTNDSFFRIDSDGNPVGEIYTRHYNYQTVVQHPGWMDLGTLWHLVIKGVGTVLIDAGRLYTDSQGNFSYQGNHQVQEGDLDRFCAAFDE